MSKNETTNETFVINKIRFVKVELGVRISIVRHGRDATSDDPMKGIFIHKHDLKPVIDFLQSIEEPAPSKAAEPEDDCDNADTDKGMVKFTGAEFGAIRRAYFAIESLEEMLAKSEFNDYVSFSCILRPIVDTFPSSVPGYTRNE